MASQPDGLSLLPPEIRIEILQKVPFRDLFAFQRVSTSFDTLIKTNPSLQYHVELEAAGFRDNPASPLGIVEKRRLLQRRRDVFQSLSTAKVDDLQRVGIGLPCGTVVLGGVLAQANVADSAVTLHFVRFASAARDIPEKRWILRVQDIGASYKTFTVDPGQDLLVIQNTRELRFLTMSAGTLHPRARKDPLKIQSPCNASIKIGGNHVSLMIYQFRKVTDVMVFDWTTHEIVHTCDRKVGTVITINFVDHRHIIMTDFAIVPTNLPATIFVKDLTDPSWRHATYHFPPWRQYRHVRDRITAQRPVTWKPNETVSCPFFPGSQDQLVVLHNYLSEQGYYTVIVVLASRLLGCLDRCTSDTSGIQVPWTEWMPQSTCTLTLQTNRISVSGTKMTVWGQTYLDVYDFGEVAVHQTQAGFPQYSQYSLGPVDSDPVGDIFAEEVMVQMKLPYVKRRVHIDDSLRHQEPVSIDEDIVLFRQVRGRPSTWRLRVLPASGEI